MRKNGTYLHKDYGKFCLTGTFFSSGQASLASSKGIDGSCSNITSLTIGSYSVIRITSSENGYNTFQI